MNRARTAFLMITLSIIVAGFAFWAAYATLIQGRTPGHDFIDEVQSGQITAGKISSIEVIEPQVGSTPFTAEEYDELPRRRVIRLQAAIARLLGILTNARAGRVHQNHPATTYRAYLKINTCDGFFLTYCDVLQDREGEVVLLSANTRNATNPNGATIYHLDNSSEVLTILEHGGTSSADAPAGVDKRSKSDPAKVLD